MPHSHHSHSGQFCKHATGTLEEVVLEAIKQGFELYGLTEHVPRYREVDLYPEEHDIGVSALLDQFELFLDEAHRLKELYAEKITLLVGLETEFITQKDLEALSHILSNYGPRIEYLVGSVHHVGELPIDFDLPTFQKCLHEFSSDTGDHKTMEHFLSNYLDSQYELISRFHPEIIGHLDLCRLYNPQLVFKDYPIAYLKLKRNIEFAVGYGALFEANAAAFRKGWDAAYPGRDILQLILELGGRLALSDDSHGPHAVGLNYYLLATYLRQAGVSELWHLKRSETLNLGQRRVVSVKLSGNWWELAFWSSKIGSA